MSQDSDLNTSSEKEIRILRMVKKTLTEVAKDTQTAPGMRHPLAAETISNIRDCLSLIVSRESELAEEQGLSQDSRPHFSDEPQDTVVVKFDSGGTGAKK